jgi:hypothetical protein
MKITNLRAANNPASVPVIYFGDAISTRGMRYHFLSTEGKPSRSGGKGIAESRRRPRSKAAVRSAIRVFKTVPS